MTPGKEGSWGQPTGYTTQLGDYGRAKCLRVTTHTHQVWVSCTVSVSSELVIICLLLFGLFMDMSLHHFCK